MITSQMWQRQTLYRPRSTKTEKSKEPNVSENKNNVDNKIGDQDKKVDYQGDHS